MSTGYHDEPHLGVQTSYTFPMPAVRSLLTIANEPPNDSWIPG
jgi:hypothetical protein